jgi:DNA-binding transcriptional regulator YiaG
MITPDDIRFVRARLGYGRLRFARWCGLQGKNAKQTVYRWEQGLLTPSEEVQAKVAGELPPTMILKRVTQGQYD